MIECWEWYESIYSHVTSTILSSLVKSLKNTLWHSKFYRWKMSRLRFNFKIFRRTKISVCPSPTSKRKSRLQSWLWGERSTRFILTLEKIQASTSLIPVTQGTTAQNHHRGGGKEAAREKRRFNEFFGNQPNHFWGQKEAGNPYACWVAASHPREGASINSRTNQVFFWD